MTDALVPDRRSAGHRCICLGGQRIDLLRRDQLLKAVGDALDGKRIPLWLASANLDHLNRFEGKADLFESGPGSQWLVLLDGMPVVWQARRRTGYRWEQLAGSDVLPALLGLCEERSARVAFVGGTDELRERLPAALAVRWPDLCVAGHWTPAREVVENEEASREMAAELAAANVDLLVVGLGKPRQERWIHEHGAATGARVTAAFGASTEFIAGVQQRAPEAMSRLGGEWAYRLCKDPRRLARRYLIEGPMGLAKLLTHP
ncbi:MAG: WecB/TagA/CpsF family glycosyltransferase [Acidobacteria bacterium]|nr:WecB/TagA/CpsF family glycosyltransferase [Acidobacteriota bacterium]